MGVFFYELPLNNFLILPRRHRDTEEKVFSLLRVSVPPWQNYYSLDSIEMGKLFKVNSQEEVLAKIPAPSFFLVP